MAVVDFNRHEAGSHPILLLVSHVLTPVLLGGAMTFGLFYLMQSLIASRGPGYSKQHSIQLVDFVRVPKLTQVRVRDLHPKKPPPPQALPQVKTSMNFNVQVHPTAFSMQAVKISTHTNLSGGWTFSSDGDYLPIVKVAPMYPTQAEMEGLEGWVVLQFTVNREGRVVDAQVVDNCAHATEAGHQPNQECSDEPNSVFDQAALNAARKFKYKPKIVDGRAVAVPHVRHKFVFILRD